MSSLCNNLSKIVKLGIIGLDMTENDENKVFYINHSGELLIWLLILLIPAIMYFVSNMKSINNEYEHKIFMPDVDGLIVGSPVRAMGIEIGHVTKIQPVKDEVFVKFIITDKTVKLPQGTSATVEFSGMAGSKSLELYLPDKGTYVDSSVPIVTVTSPKRLSDAAGLLNEMFKKVGNIIAVSSQFGAKMKKIEFPEKVNTGDSKDFLKYVDGLIDVQQERVDNFGRAINDRKKK